MNTDDDKLKNVVEMYDDISTDYVNEFFNYKEDFNYIDEFLASLNGKHILDAGSGSGRVSKYMIEKGYIPYGIDVSEELIKISSEKVPNGNFQKMSLIDLTFDNNTFDGILIAYAIQYIPPNLLDKTFQSIKRILKPNGKIIIMFPLGRGEQMADEPFRPGKKLYINYLTEKEMRELLDKHNFNILSRHTKEVVSNYESGTGKLFLLVNNEKI